jgi:hypothetical protein
LKPSPAEDFYKFLEENQYNYSNFFNKNKIYKNGEDIYFYRENMGTRDRHIIRKINNNVESQYYPRSRIDNTTQKQIHNSDRQRFNN